MDEPGGTGISRLALGTMRLDRWGMDAAALRSFLEAAADLGVTTIDTADVYCGYTCEARLGEALALAPSLRARLQVVTKYGVRAPGPAQRDARVKHYDTSRAWIVRQAERSLAALRADHLELLLLHRPDPLMDADEVAEAFATLHRDGKVLGFGVSNFAPAQVELLQSQLQLPVTANQIQISLLHTAPLFDGTLDQCQQLRVVPMAWSPLGGGRVVKDPPGPLAGVLREIGRELGGASPDQVALAWLLRLPVKVVPVLGTGRLERIRAAVAALALQLDRQQWFRLLEAAEGHEVP